MSAAGAGLTHPRRRPQYLLYLLHGRYLHYLHYLHSTPALAHTLGTHSNLGLLSRQPASIPPPAVTITRDTKHSDRDDVKIGLVTVRVVVTKGENQECSVLPKNSQIVTRMERGDVYYLPKL